MDKKKMASTASFTSCSARRRRSIYRWSAMNIFGYLLPLMLALLATLHLTTMMTVSMAEAVEIPDTFVGDTEVNHWAMRFGFHVREIAKHMTFLDDMIKGFNLAGAEVVTKNGFEMVAEMSDDIQKMMAWKIQAVQRLANTAEEAMVGHKYEENLQFDYENAKTLNKKGGLNLSLVNDKHFYNMPVNFSKSTIHVPTNVYDKAVNIVNAIKWSEHLNPIFMSNYHFDPSLSWQYFGSSTGFLRQYPGMQWPSESENWPKVDTYDCRMRPWYIEAAASPKDMVILMDGSGSMTGQKKDIAKHVALNILDTLNDNDYFHVIRFSGEPEDLVSCFNGSLVPASMENIREYKKNLQDMDTVGVANFSSGLERAFALLDENNRTGSGSNCNQAIMLITDGAPHTYRDIFERHNLPDRIVRVFTYLIGQEMTEENNVKDMACENRGFYSHVSTLAEARDQVQHYIHVMARPLVYHQKHSVIWTSVYADIADPKLSDWLFEKCEKERQRKHAQHSNRSSNLVYEFTEYVNEDTYPEDTDEGYVNDHDMRSSRSTREVFSDDWYDRIETETPFYRLMTTVGYPVFDMRNISDNRGDLLGVAGTDVPIEEITKLAPAYKLGVNGYSFAITNNGYVLFHPYLNPVHEGILKPDYNSVDLTEVELRDNDKKPREEDKDLLTLREKMIDRERNHTKLRVKVHLDDSKRVVTRLNNYFYAPLKETPFSFAIVMPDEYGMHSIKGRIELRGDPRLDPKSVPYYRNVLSLFQDSKWLLHPEWVYCSYLFNNTNRTVRSRENAFRDVFLSLIPLRKYGSSSFVRVKDVPQQAAYMFGHASRMDRNEFYCDKELVESVVFDAEATKKFGHGVRNDPDSVTSRDMRPKTAAENGITLAFVATRAGLTRWEEFEPNSSEFIRKHDRAIDELWYKRAVDYHHLNDQAFVISVPFNAGLDMNSSRVTATHALFLGSKGRKAPAAVVGLQFRLEKFLKAFEDITSKCQSGQNCSYHCQSEKLDCYLLDDSGFVIASKRYENIGRFFGEIDNNILNALVGIEIYNKIHMVDYQAVCFDDITKPDSGNILLTPINQIRNLAMFVWNKLMLFYLNYNLYNLWNADFFASSTPICDDEIPLRKPPMRRPKPCDKEFHLYQLQPHMFKDNVPKRGRFSGCSLGSPCDKYFVVQMVSNTNLLFMVVDATCVCGKSENTSLSHTEITYNETQFCELLKSNVHRRRPEQCTKHHPNENNETLKIYCGGAMKVTSSTVLVILVGLLALVISTTDSDMFTS